VAYRADPGDTADAPCAEGTVHAELAPRHVRIAVGARSIEISDAFISVVAHHPRRADRDRRRSIPVAGRIFTARDVARGGLGVWMELEPHTARAGVRRVFGLEPVDPLDPAGLDARGALDRFAHRVREALAPCAPDVERAYELGAPAAGGVDKVLIVDHGARWQIYARRLFRDRARLALVVDADGGVVIPGRHATPRVISVRSRHGVTVLGDYVRFADPEGTDLARIALPWLASADRDELARRIGVFVDAGPPAPPGPAPVSGW
jgi:hypothetical protein